MSEERTITVSASFSRKINRGNYESVDLWTSESREMPANVDQSVVDAMRGHLMKNCEAFVNELAKKYQPQ